MLVLDENYWIFIQIALKFVEVLVDNTLILVQGNGLVSNRPQVITSTNNQHN